MIEEIEAETAQETMIEIEIEAEGEIEMEDSLENPDLNLKIFVTIAEEQDTGQMNAENQQSQEANSSATVVATEAT